MRREIKRHERIKMELRLAGSSLSQIARELGVQASTVASVSRGNCRSRRIEAAISSKLGVTPERLWPDRTLARPALPSTTTVGRKAMP